MDETVVNALIFDFIHQKDKTFAEAFRRKFNAVSTNTITIKILSVKEYLSHISIKKLCSPRVANAARKMTLKNTFSATNSNTIPNFFLSNDYHSK